jgi:dihydrolipoamide dehydrogenase
MEKFDVVVIGAGPGGYPAAIRAAQLGASVAIIEREALGGSCLNWGCIPTKTLIASSDLYHRIKHAADLGIKPGRASFDYAAMKDRKDGVVTRLQGGVGQLLKANGVKVIKGQAEFVSRTRIAVTRQGKIRQIEAARTIIATGSTSAMPGFIPTHRRVMESRAFLDLAELPKSLTVLGGGVIGCEFACMAAQLGCKVTVVEMLEDILVVLDADLRRELRRHMVKTLKIKVLTGEPMQDITPSAEGVSGTVGKKTVTSEILLVSVGRTPVTDGLGLANAGIALDQSGCIGVDAQCRSAIANIFAIGDVTSGSTQLAHAATAEGITAAENACGQPTDADKLVPACIFTAPEIGCVGLSEQDAAAQGIDVAVGTYMLSGLGKAMAAGEEVGFVKWVADARTDQLLGAHAIGAHATELIAEACAAIRAELTAEELGQTIHCHPTFSEAWMEAAHALHGTCIHQPPKRRR